MSESSWPAPSTTQRQHELLIGHALPSGVFGQPGDSTVVYADGGGTREVRIRASKTAALEGYGWSNVTTELTETLAANTSGTTRVDLVVLRLDRAAWTVTVEIVQGTPGAGAPAPTYNTGSTGVTELPLAEVTVASGASTLAADKVKNRAWYIGSDGQLLCTPTTRPPHEKGRAVWDTSAGWLVSTGSEWLVAGEDSGTVSLPLAGGYNASQNNLRRRNGAVYLDLTLARTASMSTGTQYTVGTVPAGFRPPYGLQTTGLVTSLGILCVVAVRDNGAVVINPAGTVTANRSIVVSHLSWPAA